jgi:hypothetical protein
MMRVYVGTTLDQLQVLRDTGFSPPVHGRAVTPALREWYVEGDLDELEYAAAADAAHDSLWAIVAEGASARRRVVVAADVPDATVHHEVQAPDDSRRSVVRISEPLLLHQVVSIHVDDDVALADVATAAAALPAAEAGDEDAQFTVDGADGHELAWYDVTELDDVLALR